jgi:hypothetical protein
MSQYLVKIALTTLLVVAVSETAKRSTFWGSILVSLPVISLVSLGWLWSDTRDPAKISQFCASVFWLVLPSLALFALVPTLLKRGVGFWPAMAVGIIATIACYAITVQLLNRYGFSNVT